MPISQINTNSLGALAITTSQIANNAVTAAQVANNTIGTPQLNNLTSANVSQINTSTGTPSFTTVANGINVGGGILGAGDASIMKNRIINGAMVIDQRNAGASVTITNTSNTTYTLDRWGAYGSQASKFSVQQNAGSATPPVGYSKYLGVTSLSAYSVLTADYFNLLQYIEGFNTADLGWGTANAKTVTLSFQVYSSLTGTFGGSLSNASNYSYPFTYTISSANTWTTISVTIAGPTSGTWATDNSRGIQLSFGLGSGATGYAGTAGSWSANYYLTATGTVSVVGTSGATFYITGVQLEVGSSATGFEYRQYGQELALCQRYYEQIASGVMGIAYGGNSMDFPLNWKVTKRASPTISLLTGTITTDYAGTGTKTSSGASILGGQDSVTGSALRVSGWSSLTSPGFYNVYMATNWVAGSSEL